MPKVRGRDEEPPKEIVTRFGFDPRSIGRRYRNWWIIEKTSPWAAVDVEVGMLAVSARDGGSNQPDHHVGLHPNFAGSEMDGTYRTYYFRPLETATPEKPQPDS